MINEELTKKDISKIKKMIKKEIDNFKKKELEKYLKSSNNLFHRRYSAPLSPGVTCLQRLPRKESQSCTLIQTPKELWPTLRLLEK